MHGHRPFGLPAPWLDGRVGRGATAAVHLEQQVVDADVLNHIRDRVGLTALTVYLNEIDEGGGLVIPTDGGGVAPAAPGLRVHVLRHEVNVRRQLLTQSCALTSERPIMSLDVTVRRVRMHGVLKRRVAVATDAHDVTGRCQRAPRSTDHLTTIVVATETHQAAAAASRWRSRVPVAVEVLAHIEGVPRPLARRHESDGGRTSIPGSRCQRSPLCGTVRRWVARFPAARRQRE
mmetsp:Transcript_3582/g.9006  ORF Transcript_3582/g.9006 Transcript_3582/m.9006 type:complete len:233 (+) Transcript_3582:298-996(+)